MRRTAPRQGFTLIEIMIVVAIVGVLASIAIPNFRGFQCKAKQTEAKLLLKGLYTTQQAYAAQTTNFVADNAMMSELLGIEFATATYHVMTLSCTDCNENFVAQIESNFSNALGIKDIWLINEKGTLLHVSNACTR